MTLIYPDPYCNVCGGQGYFTVYGTTTSRDEACPCTMEEMLK